MTEQTWKETRGKREPTEPGFQGELRRERDQALARNRALAEAATAVLRSFDESRFEGELSQSSAQVAAVEGLRQIVDCEDAALDAEGEAKYQGTCPRCGSPRWVRASVNGGATVFPQCVPCGTPHLVRLDDEDRALNAGGEAE